MSSNMESGTAPGGVIPGITTGVTGGGWRGNVTRWGGIEPWGDGAPLDWHIAADDRWHSPQREAAVRQRRIDGTAVVETRVRIPDGDAVQRVYSVPDRGGLTIIEVENESPLPIAVAFTHGALRSARAPTAPIEGITLPEGSVAFPVGHHATLTVALAHDGSGAGILHGGLPTAAGVARGWLATVERASRLLLPDAALSERFIAERCELALVGPEHPDNDPVGFLLGVGQLVRMGEKATEWIPDLAHALELAAKSAEPNWALSAALDAADHVLVVAAEKRARRDLLALSSRLACSHVLPLGAPADCAYFITWVERLIADVHSEGGRLLPSGMPAGWEGNNFEVYGLPTGALGSVSFAVRWHGERPAVLWEQSGPPVTLSAPAIAPGWQTTDVKGEALWPQPDGLVPVARPQSDEPVDVVHDITPAILPPVPGEGESFS